MFYFLIFMGVWIVSMLGIGFYQYLIPDLSPAGCLKIILGGWLIAWAVVGFLLLKRKK